MAYGPTTINSGSIALGLAQIRIGGSSVMTANSGETAVKLTPAASYSIGAVNNSKFVGNTEWYKHSSGFPLTEDMTMPLRDSAAIECSFEEITPYNLSLALGNDPTGLTLPNSGEIALGKRLAPKFVRAEIIYTFPDGLHSMAIIFPKAQVTSSIEVDLQKEEAANVPITIESKQCSHTVWTDMPLGRIAFVSGTIA